MPFFTLIQRMGTQSKPTLETHGFELCQGYRIRLLKASNGERFQADLGRKSGRHVRKTFTSIKAARKWVYDKSNEAERKGLHVIKFTDAERDDAVEALTVLKPYDINLRTAAQFYQKHHQPVSKETSFSGLVDEYLAHLFKRVEEGNIRPIYAKDSKTRLKPFCNEWETLAANVIDASDIDRFLDKMEATLTNRKNYIRYLSCFYSWAMKNGKADSNPAKTTNQVVIPRETPKIYTPTEAETILQKTAQLHPELIPYIAIGFFAGIRPEELLRIEWADIDLEIGEIHVHAGQAKTKDARIVKIQPNLKSWLKQHPNQKGLVFPYSGNALRQWRSDIFTVSGIKMIPDGLRHSFATYHLARFDSSDKTCEEMGHRTPAMLFRHYRGLAKSRETLAKKYFSIRPKAKLPSSAKPKI